MCDGIYGSHASGINERNEVCYSFLSVTNSFVRKSLNVFYSHLRLNHEYMDAHSPSRIDATSLSLSLFVGGFAKGTRLKDEWRRRHEELTSGECVEVLKMVYPHALPIRERMEDWW